MSNTPRLSRGTLVFWMDEDDYLATHPRPKPWWILQWQPLNGPGAYFLVDSDGTHAVAAPDELTLWPWLEEDSDDQIRLASKGLE